jgi:cobalt-zinc-cadmium efflux system outer membrane protein
MVLLAAIPRWAAAEPSDSGSAAVNCEGQRPGECQPQESDVLSLAEALALAVEHSPELEPFAWELRAREAASLYAGVRPNPEFNVEVENFGRSSGAGSETTFAVEQQFELGAKRSKRAAVMQLDRTLADWDYQARRAQVQAAVIGSFAEVLAAQERVALARDFAQISASESQAVGKRVAAGAASALEAKQAAVGLAMNRLDEQLALRKLEIARNALAAEWGAPVARFSAARGAFFDVDDLPPLDRLEARAGTVPDVARWESEVEQRQASAALEESLVYPDLQVRGGVRRLAEDGGSALVFEMRMPLPLFNRNQGPLGQARFLVNKAERERRAARLRARTELQAAYQTLAASRHEVVSLREGVLPLAEDAFESARGAYRMGRSSYVEVVGTQRSLYELRGRHIEALATYHGARAQLARVLGMRLEELPGAAPEQTPRGG